MRFQNDWLSLRRPLRLVVVDQSRRRRVVVGDLLGIVELRQDVLREDLRAGELAGQTVA